MQTYLAHSAHGVALVGLDWHDLSDAPNKRSALDALAKNAETRRVTQYKAASGAHVAAFLTQDASDDAPRDAVALAPLLAGVPDIAPDAIFVSDVGEAAYMVALRSGMPVPGYEGFGPAASIYELAQRFIARASSGVTVYGDSRMFQGLPLTLDEVFAKSTTRKQAGFTKAVSPRAYALLGVAMVTAVVGAGAYIAMLQHSAAEARRVALAAPDPNVLYLRNAESDLAQKASLPLTLPALLSVVESTPYINGGWVFERATCQGGMCTVMLTNDFGTNASFEPPPGTLSVTRSLEGASLSYTLAYPSDTTGLAVPSMGNYESVLVNSVSEFQPLSGLGLKLVVSEPTLYGAPAIPESQLVLAIREGSFVLEGPLWGIESARALPTTSSLEALEVYGGDSPSFKLMGRYYVK